jgi:6-phosphogluconolactonase
LLSGLAYSATYVYISNNEDGNITSFTLQPDGTLQPGPKSDAGKLVMPMSTSPDKKYLFAAVRSKPFKVITYGIDRKTGELKQLSSAPLAESYPYIRVDNSGKYLLGASYGAHQVGVNKIGKDGKVSDPIQVIPTARNAHAIITDKTNRYVFVPHLGTDQIFQFKLDAKTGKLSSNTPATVQIAQGAGPRHIIRSADNKFFYLLNELDATVVSLALDQKTGLLTQVSSVSSLAPDTKLVRGVAGAPAGSTAGPARDVSNDIWASDLHLSPDGKFLYAAERRGSSINTLSVDGASGKLSYVGSTPTEKQPRGFAIEPKGKYMVVAGEKSETLSVFERDAGTGALKLLKQYPSGKGANWVEIVSFD